MDGDWRPDLAQRYLAKKRLEERRLSRDEDDPIFSLEELSRMTGLAQKTIRDRLRDAGEGTRYGERNHKVGLRYSDLMRLAKDYGWLR